MLPRAQEARIRDALANHPPGTIQAHAAGDFASTFSTLVQQRAVALLLDVELFLTDQRTTIVAVAARHKQPAVYGLRELVDGAS
jgi:putative tryptophan/tyrosine transport system substrate-binding protein